MRYVYPDVHISPIAPHILVWNLHDGGKDMDDNKTALPPAPGCPVPRRPDLDDLIFQDGWLISDR